MNDPHVESLTYRVVTPNYLSYKNPPPIVGTEPTFSYRLENGRLIAQMTEHHATVETARECVEELLRVWELDAALRAGKKEFGFAFDQAHVIDRDPLVNGAEGMVAGTCDLIIMTDAFEVETVSRDYPAPPTGLKASLDAETMLYHFTRYTEGREKLTSMGFYCLSLLQWRTGSKTARRDMATLYRIDLEVLNTLGRLTSEVGDLTTARKLEKSSNVRPHTAEETAWVEEAVKMLIRRKAERDYDPNAALALITMADLPAL